MKTTFSLTAAAVMSVALGSAVFAEPVKMNLTVAGKKVEITVASSRFFEDPTYCGGLGETTTVEDHLLGGITFTKFVEINDLIEIHENTEFEPYTMLCIK